MLGKPSRINVNLGYVAVLCSTVVFGMLITDIGGYEISLMHRYSFSAIVISLLSTSMSYGLVIGSLIAGLLIDRYGAGRISVYSYSLVAFGMLLFYLGTTASTLEIGQFFAGLGLAAVFPVGQKIIVQNFSNDRLPLLSGLCLAAYTLGSSLSITGIIDLISMIGFRDTKLTICVLCLILTILLAWYRKINDGQQVHQLHFKEILLGQLKIITDKQYLLVVLVNALLCSFIQIFLGLWADLYLNDLLHDPTFSKNLISISFCVAAVASIFCAGLYFKYLQPLGWILLQCIVTFLSYSVLLFAPTTWLNYWVIICLFQVCAVCIGANLTFSCTYTIRLFKKALSGSVISLYNSLYFLFFAIVTPVIGLELHDLNKTNTPYSLVDFRTSFLILLLMYGISIIIILFLLMKDKNKKIIQST